MDSKHPLVHVCSRTAIFFALITQLQLFRLSCRVRHLSESVNDLFREVSLLRMRLTELSQRLTTMEPLLRHYGYREKRGVEGAARGGGAHSVKGWMPNLTRYHRPGSPGSPGSSGPPGGTRLVKREPVKTAVKTQ